MRQPSLSGIVKRRFLHCVHHHGQSVYDVVQTIGIAPGDLCRIIAGQGLNHLPLLTYFRIAHWLAMPLPNVTTLAGYSLSIDELIRLGMDIYGYRSTSAQDQILAAHQAGISVAVFRRALHGYDTFKPSIRTCDHLATWLHWTGFEADDIAFSANMLVRYRVDGRRVTVTPDVHKIGPYHCACGRLGCMVPAHIPGGPRRKWRSDACRMWAKRRAKHGQKTTQPAASPLPHRSPIVRFIMINERPVPVRF